jgi:hypothetical protein
MATSELMDPVCFRGRKDVERWHEGVVEPVELLLQSGIDGVDVVKRRHRESGTKGGLGR